MATINYRPKPKGKDLAIYIRLSAGKIRLEKKTKYIFKKTEWQSRTSMPKQNSETLKNLHSDLAKFKTRLNETYNKALSKNVLIDSKWFNQVIENNAEPLPEEKEKYYLDEAFNIFLTEAPIGQTKPTKRAVSTTNKYKTLHNKILSYQELNETRYEVKHVNDKFIKTFYKYLIGHETQKLASNTAGRYIKIVKTVCIDAKNRGAETHHELEAIKGHTEKAMKISLTFDEIEQINQTIYKHDYLENAKDWLVIGCYIGQRVSDLLNLTASNIIIKNGLQLIDVKQQKTGKTVIIPINEPVQKILDKRGGNFPRSISNAKFNLYIKIGL